MVKVDIVRAKAVSASITESRKKLRKLCGAVNETLHQMTRDNGLYKMRSQMDSQLEELEQDLYLLGQFDECLQEILPMYMTYEERTAVYAEESQVENSEQLVSLMEYEIPEHIFRLLG